MLKTSTPTVTILPGIPGLFGILGLSGISGLPGKLGAGRLAALRLAITSAIALSLAGCSSVPDPMEGQLQMMPPAAAPEVAMLKTPARVFASAPVIEVPMPLVVRSAPARAIPVSMQPFAERRGAVAKIGKPYEVAGNWYYPAPGDGYDGSGLASWYGPEFQGRSTANGEIYNMNRLTAAHPTLPMPCYATVTNLENGRSIVVRINDRGPYKAGRIIDLSRRAAKLLEVTHSGTAKVRVKYLRAAPLLADERFEEQYLIRQAWYRATQLASDTAMSEPSVLQLRPAVAVAAWQPSVAGGQ